MRFSRGVVRDYARNFRPPVLLQVREADPVPPRRLNASLPRDSSWGLTGHNGRVSRLPVHWLTPEMISIIPGKPADILTGLQRVTSPALNAGATLPAAADEPAHEVRIHPLSGNGTTAGPLQARISIGNPMGCALSPDAKWLAGSGL